MKLSELNPCFLRHGGKHVRDAAGDAIPLREGVGLSMDCPCGCGTRMMAMFENPLDGGPPVSPDPDGNWRRDGDTFETLTLSPSIQRVGGCGYHGWIRNGEVVVA